MMNQTVLMEFLLLRFTENQLLLRLHAVFLLLIYLLAIVENLIIILLTILDQHLHTPMYFFLRHLPFLDMYLISATVPKSILNSIAFTDSISFLGCVLQVFLVIVMSGSKISILTAMSYDHYIAICRPLHYEAVMSKEVCVQLVLVSWLSGGVFRILYSAGTFSLNFCGSTKIHQLFCDVPTLLKLTCSVEHATINVSVAIGVCYGFSCLVCIVVSYVHVFSTVLKIPTRQKQGKAFSTCLPHLFVVSTFLLTGAIAYLKPNSDEPSLPDLFVSMFYSVVPPTLNPVIYCLRRKDIKLALVKVLWRLADYFTGKLNLICEGGVGKVNLQIAQSLDNGHDGLDGDDVEDCMVLPALLFTQKQQLQLLCHLLAVILNVFVDYLGVLDHHLVLGTHGAARPTIFC
ncbi:olfactory receptor 14K1-like [Neomonachus schauinslandi]|uniref:Olfactory receptor 14K1-like n=1 Tax=Neomonachus schauinslandi TaxID=29088 RepID=A0A8M1MGK8_NEOSC|nr:olfactory receptor 14K1-like [Neomonachus schauinslandi]